MLWHYSKSTIQWPSQYPPGTDCWKWSKALRLFTKTGALSLNLDLGAWNHLCKEQQTCHYMLDEEECYCFEDGLWSLYTRSLSTSRRHRMYYNAGITAMSLPKEKHLTPATPAIMTKPNGSISCCKASHRSIRAVPEITTTMVTQDNNVTSTGNNLHLLLQCKIISIASNGGLADGNTTFGWVIAADNVFVYEGYGTAQMARSTSSFRAEVF